MDPCKGKKAIKPSKYWFICRSVSCGSPGITRRQYSLSKQSLSTQLNHSLFVLFIPQMTTDLLGLCQADTRAAYLCYYFQPLLPSILASQSLPCIYHLKFLFGFASTTIPPVPSTVIWGYPNQWLSLPHSSGSYSKLASGLDLRSLWIHFTFLWHIFAFTWCCSLALG